VEHRLDPESERLRGLLARISGQRLSSAKTLKWLEDARLWTLLDDEAFISFYAEWDPKERPRPLPEKTWKHGGGKNSPHTKPDPKLKMPERVKEIEDEIKRLMSLPPFPGRKEKIDEWKRKKKHAREKGEETGEEHSRKGKGYQAPGTREEEKQEEDD